MFTKLLFVFLCTCVINGLCLKITGSLSVSSDEGDVDLALTYQTSLDRLRASLIKENSTESAESDEVDDYNDDDNFDSWSIVWYIASFGGLIVFFLVVSCSEWCCRKHVRDQQSSHRALSSSPSPIPDPETPPPAYDLFAPPSYDSLAYSRSSSSEKSEYDVYVVPVDALDGLVVDGDRRDEEPPSYAAVSSNQQRILD